MKTPHKLDTGLERAVYEVRSGATLGGTKEAIALASESQTASSLSGSAGGLISAFGHNPGVVAALGVTAAFSAAFTQMEYYHERAGMKRLYEEELAAKIGKSTKKVNDKDLETVARGSDELGIEGNPVIAQGLDKMRRMRNLGVVLSIAASLTAFGVVSGLFAGSALAGVTGFVIKSMVGLAAYNAARIPMHWAGERMFGLHHKITQDRIVELEKDREDGKAITRQQVFDVFVSANPELSHMIESRYGKSFDLLDMPTRYKITESIGNLMQIGLITDAINDGRLNITELAFASVGQVSNVPLKNPETGVEEKGGLLESIKAGIGKVMNHFRSTPALQPDTIVETPPGSVSYAARLGRSNATKVLSHVERLQQSSSQPELRQR